MPKIPSLSSSEMSELDRMMIKDYGIQLFQMMENAGRATAAHSAKMLGGTLDGKRVAVLAGKGNNGGGGLASARHMHNWGGNVEVFLSSKRDELREAPAKQLQILDKMRVPILEGSSNTDLSDFDLIIDALLGYNQKGDPRGRVADLIDAANSSEKMVLSLDIPTGLDPDTGHPNQPCLKADQTLTLALPKNGLVMQQARPYVGILYLADISVPREYYASLGVERSIFASGPIVPVDLQSF